MDAAHDWTDDQIEALAKKFEGVYGEAARDMRKSLETHLASFERENAEWARLVESGAQTQANYDAWRRAQATRTDYLHGMVDRLATDATRANQKALDMVNDRIPRVYAENANFGAYQVESGLGFDTHSFDLYDESTVRRLMATTEHDQIIHDVIPVGPPRPDLQSLRVDLDAAKDVRWNCQKFTAAVTQSILQGESIPNAAKRLMGVLNMDKGMATRAARTAMTSAENAGRVDSYKRAKAMGIELEQEWMATLDGRTRYSHRQLDGQHVPVGEKFEVEGHEIEFPGDPKAHPSETYNCFVKGTLACSDTAIERSYRHEYSGKLVTIKTASGIEFTCTPNHPILTMSGWVAANLLHEGDDLCIARVGDSSRSGVNPDINHVQASMEAIHDLLALRSRKRVAGLDVNFHGDVPASDVEVVGEEWPLRLDAEASGGEGVAELVLEPTDPAGLRPCPSVKGFGRVMASAPRGLGREGVASTLLGCQFAHPHVHGIGTVAPFDPSIAEHPSDNIAGMSDAFGDSFLGITTEIGVDYIVGVEITHTRGTHVYNLQTSDGYYFVGSEGTDNVIIAHNCRCTLVAWFPGIEKEDPERWSRLPKGMSYDEWKSGKLAQGATETALKHVDMSSPLWSQLGSVDASEVAAKVDELLEGAHGRAAELWEKFEGQLTMNNPEWDGGAYFTHRGNRGVSMNVRNSLDDVGDRGTLATWFHEFGHHIDNLSNDAYKFSYTSVDYGNRMFHDTLKREVAANIKEVQASMTARLNELKRDRDIMGMYNEGLLPWHSRYSATMYQQAREHIDDADWLRAHHLPSVAHKSTVEEREERLYKKFSEDAQVPKRVVPIKNARQRAGKEITEAGHDTQLALGDIYEGATKGECQDTYGHTNGYWEYDDNLPKEAFAEFYSAECIYSVRPEVLNVMMKRLPDSYEAYKRIVGVILDA